MLKWLNYSVAFGFLLLALFALGSAYVYHVRVNEEHAFLEMMQGHPMPHIAYEASLSYIEDKEALIPQLVCIGVVLLGLGYLVFRLPDLRALRLLAVLFCVLLASSVPMAWAPPAVCPEPERQLPRWYAGLDLYRPLDVYAVGGQIYVFDNDVVEAADSFVAFHVWLSRASAELNRKEWLEAGYIEDTSGFYAYTASLIAQVYHEETVPIPSTDYLDTYIMQTGDENTYTAYVACWVSMTVTFTIGAPNLCHAGGESSNINNTLNGHFSKLWYARAGNSYSWSIVKPYWTAPYYVERVGTSTDEFYTRGPALPKSWRHTGKYAPHKV